MTACSEPGCERPHHSRGMCKACYERKRRSGAIEIRQRNHVLDQDVQRKLAALYLERLDAGEKGTAICDSMNVSQQAMTRWLGNHEQCTFLGGPLRGPRTPYSELVPAADELAQRGLTPRQIASDLGVSEQTVYRARKALRKQETKQLDNMLSSG